MKGYETKYRVNDQGMIVEEIYEATVTKLERISHQENEEFFSDEKIEVAC